MVKKMTSECKPRVSIGMPVYNGELFIGDALDSILAQTFKDFELIISDNGSTDATEGVCRAYLSKDPRIRYFRNETNRGAAYNFNKCIELSSGEYFKWAAADDLCAPDYLERCVAVLDREPEVILCYGKTSYIDVQGNVIRQHNDGLNLRSANVSERFWLAILKMRTCNAAYGLIRSDVLRKTAKLGNYRASDKVLLAELSVYGQFCEIPDRLFFRREHPEASSSNKSLEDQQEFFDPETKGRIFMASWRHLFEHLAIVRRAPLTSSKKVRLTLIVLRYGIRRRHRLMKEPLAALVQIVRKISTV